MQVMGDYLVTGFKGYEADFLHNNVPVDCLPVVTLPSFDLHMVEEALLVNHELYEGKPLTRQQALKAIRQYRQFLRDHKAAGMPEKFTVPSLTVDRVWHTHMCETRQYSQDCMAYFGQMFHHASSLCNGGTGGGGGMDGDGGDF